MSRRRPKITRAEIEQRALVRWRLDGHEGPLPSHYFFAVRGYRPLSMGPTKGNDPGVYDDMIAFVEPEAEHPEDANTDPSRYGWNAGAGKPMAVLNAGCWPFRRGPHRGRTPAFRQFTTEEARAANVPNDGRFSVTRTYAIGDPRNYQEAGYFAINIHPGGNNGTSSEGCQTVPRAIADEFLQRAWDKTNAAKVNVIWYILEDPVA